MSLLRKINYGTIYISLAIVLFSLIIFSAGVGAVHLSWSEIIDLARHRLGADVEVNSIHEGLFFVGIQLRFECDGDRNVLRGADAHRAVEPPG